MEVVDEQGDDLLLAERGLVGRFALTPVRHGQLVRRDAGVGPPQAGREVPFMRRIIMRLPREVGEEYIYMTPFTPRQKDNLTAWVVVRNDGENYGQFVEYRAHCRRHRRTDVGQRRPVTHRRGRAPRRPMSKTGCRRTASP